VTQQSTPLAHAFMPHNPPAGTAAGRENLDLFGGAFFEAAGRALTTALNRPLTVQVFEAVPMALHELLADLDPPRVFVEVAYQRGMVGTHWLVVSRRNALSLAGDFSADVVDIETRHGEAIRDTVNQLLHAAAPPLMPLFARSVAYAPVTVHVVGRDEALPGDLQPEDKVWIVRARAVGDDTSIDLALTIDEGLAREICALGTVEPEPAPAAVERFGGIESPSKIDMILDVTLPVAVELGRARMQIQEILKLTPGAVIALDRSAGDPVELFINDRPIAKGEVVIIDENFGVRLTSIVTTTERIRTLR
jgi:flagellar motor switch protein FliN